jgi:hypothetical protein
MNKFSEVYNESKRYDFVLTDSEFDSYKDFINELLEKTYSKRAINISDRPGKKLMIYEAFGYETTKMPGREFSILGKVNTNRLLISKIWEKFKINDYRHLENLVNKLKFDLFDERGKFFKSNPGTFSVWDTIRFTEMKGEENEDAVCKFIKELYGNESNPIREVTSSYKDMILGIDITFKIDGEDKTCQVKPLKFANFKERGVVKIYSSGVIKEYKTDFICFVDLSKNNYLFFVNKGATFDSENQTITLPYQNLVNKKYRS